MSPTDDLLASLRPTDADVDALWPADERASILPRVHTDHSVVAFRPRRGRLVAVGAAAAVAALALAAPVVIGDGHGGPGASAVAAEVDRLAQIAAAQPYAPLQPGQLVHTITQQWQGPGEPQGLTDLQTGERTTSTQPPMTSEIESWADQDRTIWSEHTEHDGEHTSVDYYRFHATPAHLADDGTYNPTPEFLASLPTDPDALDTWLRAHRQGSASADEAVFVAVGDLMRSHLVPPQLRLALFEVLKRTAHVSVGDATKDALGRPVVELDFIDDHLRPDEVQALLFSTRTAEVNEERTSLHGKLAFRATNSLTEAVDSVPAEIRERAVDQ